MASFLTMQQELADRLNLDQTVAANATRLQRWLNLIQQDICSRWPFDFLQDRTIVQTTADKTAGTVTVAAGGTAVAGTGTSFASTDVRSMIQFSGDTNWYEVTAYTSATSITIGQAVAAAVTAATYTLRKVYYDLPSACFQVEDMRQTNSPAKLVSLGVWNIDSWQPDVTTTGIPTGYVLFREDPDTAASAAKQIQFSLFPAPDNVYNIEIRYFKELTDMSVNTDVTQIPLPYHNVLIDGSEWLGSKFLNDSEEPALKAMYEAGIAKMIEMESSHGDRLPILGSQDERPSTRFIPFPAAFEQPK